jgi:hypothetical protein
LSRNAGKVAVNLPILPANFTSLAVDPQLSIPHRPHFSTFLPSLSRNVVRAAHPREW